jgi:hypothetical protein
MLLEYTVEGMSIRNDNSAQFLLKTKLKFLLSINFLKGVFPDSSGGIVFLITGMFQAIVANQVRSLKTKY